MTNKIARNDQPNTLIKLKEIHQTEKLDRNTLLNTFIALDQNHDLKLSKDEIKNGIKVGHKDSLKELLPLLILYDSQNKKLAKVEGELSIEEYLKINNQWRNQLEIKPTFSLSTHSADNLYYTNFLSSDLSKNHRKDLNYAKVVLKKYPSLFQFFSLEIQNNVDIQKMVYQQTKLVSSPTLWHPNIKKTPALIKLAVGYNHRLISFFESLPELKKVDFCKELLNANWRLYKSPADMQADETVQASLKFFWDVCEKNPKLKLICDEIVKTRNKLKELGIDHPDRFQNLDEAKKIIETRDLLESNKLICQEIAKTRNKLKELGIDHPDRFQNLDEAKKIIETRDLLESNKLKGQKTVLYFYTKSDDTAAFQNTQINYWHARGMRVVYFEVGDIYEFKSHAENIRSKGVVSEGMMFAAHGDRGVIMVLGDEFSTDISEGEEKKYYISATPNANAIELSELGLAAIIKKGGFSVLNTCSAADSAQTPNVAQFFHNYVQDTHLFAPTEDADSVTISETGGAYHFDFSNGEHQGITYYGAPQESKKGRGGSYRRIYLISQKAVPPQESKNKEPLQETEVVDEVGPSN